MISTLQELYERLDEFFPDISEVCARCSYDDCMGYIRLLPEEAANLYEKGLSLLEVNEEVSFINPFSEGEEIDVTRLKPKCPHCKDRMCAVRNLRPFICRLYPLSFAVEGGRIYLVLHLDCQYAKEKEGDQEFKSRATALVRQINPEMLRRILDCCLSYDSVTVYPYGLNRYLKLFEVERQKPHSN